MFTQVCEIIGTTNLFTTTYNPQGNVQVESLNRTLLKSLRQYVRDHPKDCDLLCDLLTYGYNFHVHRTTKAIPFEVMLS